MSTALKEAIDANDADAARKALKAVKNLGRKLPKSLPPLEYASSQGADAVVPVLLEAGAPLGDGSGFAGNHPFALAAAKEHVSVLKQLAARGIPENVASNALSDSILNGKFESARFILQNFKFPLTETVVEFATWWNSGKFLDLMVEHGADVNVANDGSANYEMAGIRPLHRAVYGGHLRSVEMLLKHGAEPNATDALGRTPLMHLASYMPSLLRNKAFRATLTDEQRKLWGKGNTRGDRQPDEGMETARLLLKSGANAAATDRYGHDALVIYEWERRRNRANPIPSLSLS